MTITSIRKVKVSPLFAAVTVLIVATATIAGAWIFQWAGYLPCELCLKQRWAYYIGIPFAALVTLSAWRGPRDGAAYGLVILSILFLGSALFGTYHAGVEWGFWPGPADCTGSLDKAGSMQDFLSQLSTVKVVRCDAVAIRIFSLSLAGWNGVISLAMAALAALGARRALA
jgi:disulfide bond formation protein DsbB